MSDNYSRDPDALFDDTIVAVLEIKCRRDGSMSVAGCIDNQLYALAMLDNAKDAVKRHHLRMNAGKQIITPHYDSPMLDVAKVA